MHTLIGMQTCFILEKNKKRKSYMFVTWHTVKLTKVQSQVTLLRMDDVMFMLKSLPLMHEDRLTLQWVLFNLADTFNLEDTVLRACTVTKNEQNG